MFSGINTKIILYVGLCLAFMSLAFMSLAFIYPTEQYPNTSLTVVVAAKDSSAHFKSIADYICDGVNDQVEINQALAAAGPGGTVTLSGGTFYCNALSTPSDIRPLTGQTLQGQGESSTTIHYTSGSNYHDGVYRGSILLLNDSVTLKNFYVNGTGFVRVSANHAKVQHVTVSTDEGGVCGSSDDCVKAGFLILADPGDITDIEVTNSSAVDCHGFGFLFDGKGREGDHTISNVYFADDKATNHPGNLVGHSWEVGFSFQEWNNLDGLLVERCYAAGNWESGFHMDYRSGIWTKNVTLRDCISNNNGNKPDSVADPQATAAGVGSWRAGYAMLMENTQLENCVSENNVVGFYMTNGCNIVNGSDISSRIGVKLDRMDTAVSPLYISGKFQNEETPIQFMPDMETAQPVTLENLQISSITAKSGPAIKIDSYNGASITVRNSQISNYATGVAYWRTTDRPKVCSVSVTGATNDFINCDTTCPSSDL
jgi:hypothetical protein